ncbi:MAG: hypothetical protein BWY32_03559 [bacterium ADurb.Bin243]|nr:MAG: hypothetical protein BWY32_03559 [bacterium ADurb.Bin243]
MREINFTRQKVRQIDNFIAFFYLLEREGNVFVRGRVENHFIALIFNRVYFHRNALVPVVFKLKQVAFIEFYFKRRFYGVNARVELDYLIGY